jgi:hypothetical protein
MYLSGAYPDMSDNDLDALYASTYASFKGATGQVKVTWAEALAQLGMEITDRLMNVKDFVLGIFGHVRFPQYDAIQKRDPSLMSFQQSTEAQTLTASSASNVATSVKGTVGKLGSGAAGLGLAVVALLIFLRRK